MFPNKTNERKNAHAVREAIDSYPGGLCFATADGRPILVNRQMNRLVSLLTGHTLLDAEALWKELKEQQPSEGCQKMSQDGLIRTDGTDPGNRLYFSFPDQSVWCFQKQVLNDDSSRTVQLEAFQVTELYQLSQELYQNNLRLQKLQERQRNLLSQIVQINRAKELLRMKVRIHDELGRCLMATDKSLTGQTLDQDITALTTDWNNAIRDLTNIPLSGGPEAVPENELNQVAEMIGCRIIYEGERPVSRSALLLFYASVREALTNAVRHAGANLITVKTTFSAGSWHVEISDNGNRKVTSLQEGNGLSNLRSRLEQEGAVLKIRCSGGVTLIADIPDDTPDCQ